jgi:hypothetical protein
VGFGARGAFDGRGVGVAPARLERRGNLCFVVRVIPWALIGSLAAVAACGGDPSPESKGSDLPPADLSHTFEPITIGVGVEQTGVCQSWTLENAGPLLINKVVERNTGGLHHSNWIWVNDSAYPGPDGTWPCAERGFEQVAAAAVGGVFFAQSTQALNDTQAFGAGVAFRLPARVRVIGDLHLLNAGTEQLATSVRFDVYTLPADELRVELQPMAFTNTELDIAPNAVTHAHMKCQVPQPDFDVHYVLPHFHELGQAMQIDVVGGPGDGTSLFRSSGGDGEAWGQTFDPPFSIRGAASLGITCEYENPRATSVGYGVGDQEMCVALIYSSGKKAGGTSIGTLGVTDSGGVHRTEATCLAVSL